MTKIWKRVAALALGLSSPVAATGATPLDGNWTVDLSVKATDPPYTRPMTLNLAADGTVTGLFYQSTIEAGRWKADRGRTCVSFRTNDGVGPYHTAACLVGVTAEGQRVEGQTWAEKRNFLFNWNAVRAK